MSDGVALKFRAELYNAFNRTHFGTPNTVVTNTNFGRITGTFSGAARDPARRKNCVLKFREANSESGGDQSACSGTLPRQTCANPRRDFLTGSALALLGADRARLPSRAAGVRPSPSSTSTSISATAAVQTKCCSRTSALLARRRRFCCRLAAQRCGPRRMTALPMACRRKRSATRTVINSFGHIVMDSCLAPTRCPISTGDARDRTLLEAWREGDCRTEVRRRTATRRKCRRSTRLPASTTCRS